MRKVIRSALLRLFSSVGLFPVRMTRQKEVLSLIRKLSPQCVGKDLIRLGPNSDGGYLVPNDLVGITACFSPGVSYVSGFERDCAELGMEVFLADHAVDGAADTHKRFNFSKKFVGATTDKAFMTLDNWVNSSRSGEDEDLLLQMDIEGFEYEVILNVSDCLMKKFRIIVVEFHDLNQLWNEHYFRIASRALEKVLLTHTCVHIHPNNTRTIQKVMGISIPPLMEFTFLRDDRISSCSPSTEFPHPFDFDCCENPHISLPKCWYGHSRSAPEA